MPTPWKLLQRKLIVTVALIAGAGGVTHAAADCGFNVDAIGVSAPGDLASDSLLILRHVLGIDGPALIAGTRVDQTPVNVAANIAAINAHLLMFAGAQDIDASGSVDVNDAIIIARYMAGFRGAALTAGLTLAGTRNAFADIETYIATGCPSGGPQQTSGTIGALGGALHLPDGMKLIVPPGALVNPTKITIREAALPPGTILPVTGVAAGKVYAFEPDGLSFLVPVMLTVPYDPTLLPLGYPEGDVLIHRRSSAPEFHIVGDEIDVDIESPGQAQNLVAKTLSVRIRGFSSYGAVGQRQAPSWVPATLTLPSGTATVVVRQPPGGTRTTKSVNQGNCNGGSVALPVRTGAAVQGVVIHTTNGANPVAGINGALGWSSDNCVRDFTHYMIDKNGDVYQITDDLRTTNHVGGTFSASVTPRTDLVNGNTVGIEVLNNVGEPFDGQQIASLIRLVDFLMEKFSLSRPARNATTGLYAPNRTNIATGGERVITHFDFNGKCDPIGSMRSSGVYYPVNNVTGCATPAVPIAQGDAAAPSLLDAVYDALAMLQRDRQHTGIILASGGDALGLAAPGNGGNVTLRDDAAAVAGLLGTARPQIANENIPLIVGPGVTRALTGQQTFTDAIIAGRLEVAGDLDLRLIGTFYLSPTGRVVLRNGINGGNLSITTRGVPIIQGLIEAVGADATASDGVGGNGGTVTVTAAGAAPWLIPTIISRGGDADFASPPVGTGGAGGNVVVNVQTGSLLLGGGVGVQTVANDISSARPPIRDVVDRVDLPPPPQYIGERLPPPPPFNKYWSVAAGTRVAGRKEALRTAGFQQGFARGILTTGGTGGAGQASATTNVNGGTGGVGGNITLTVSAQGSLRFKDVDLITGADVETALKDILLPEGGVNKYAYFPATGSLGGTGRNQTGNIGGGFGGLGGQAGNISVNGTLFPAPVAFAPVGPLGAGEIVGINRPLNSVRPHDYDDFIYDFVFGRRIEATDANGNRLYRLRLDLMNDEPLGGSGGIPSGGIAGEFPGWFGTKGANGTLSGLPAR